MVRILHFIYGIGIGGAETFIANIVQKLNTDEYHFDFAVQNETITNPIIKEYIENSGTKIFILPKFPLHIWSQYKVLKDLINTMEYDYIHIHMNAALNPVPLILAANASKNTKFIIHSHSVSNNAGGFIGKILHYLNSRVLINQNCLKVACSNMAGKWMFGNSSFTILDNAVDVQHLQFNKLARKEIRMSLGIGEDDIVIGNVGRFVAAKNHFFMIDVFAQFVEHHPDSKLLLVGDGPIFKMVKDKVKKAGLTEKVLFTGVRTDIAEVLSAMDCFIFPSLFEGLGFVAVEAQANGLDVVASDAVPQIININNHVKFIPLNEHINIWCDALRQAVNRTSKFDRNDSPINNTCFDLKILIQKIQAIYATA